MTQKKKWGDLSSRQQAVVLALASIQVSLAVTAWADLVFRPTAQIRGAKAKWAGIIAINFIGPVLYFTRASRR